VKRAVLRAESEAAIRLAELAIQETGADGVYISWHEGHRESHDFGGQTFTVAEYRERVLPKLREPNCYHRPYPVFLSATAQPWWTNNRTNPFKLAEEFLKPFNEMMEQLKKLDEEIAKAKDRIKRLREIGFTREADKVLETLRELERQRDALTKTVGRSQPELKSPDWLPETIKIYQSERPPGKKDLYSDTKARDMTTNDMSYEALKEISLTVSNLARIYDNRGLSGKSYVESIAK